MRKHDIEVGVFLDVVGRHGKDACESRQFADLHKRMVQLLFPWGE
jgi:hypothetical protein